MYRRIALLLLLGLASAPAVARAQDWRTVNTLRQYAGEDRLEVDIEYGAGVLNIAPAEGGALYRAELRYDAEAFEPKTVYADGRLRLGIEGRNKINLSNQEGARLDLALGTEAPVDLDLAFGAVEADLELGGLRLENVQIATGASETTLRFSKPNRIRAEQIRLEVGAAEFKAYGLGNANASQFDLDGGVGDMLLDFTGRWQGDMEAEIDVGIGSITLRLPRGLGVRISKDSFMSSFDSEGLVKRGDVYYSENWEDAEHRLTLSIDAALGSIDIDWVDPE